MIRGRKHRGMGLKTMLAWIFLIGLLIGCIPLQTFAEETGNTVIHLLDVGQGLSVLIQSEGENLLYDGGGREASSFVVSYLKDHGAAKLDVLAASHYDEDHLSGLVGCLHALDVKEVIGPDYVKDSQIYTSFMEAVEQSGLAVVHPAVGDAFDIGSCHVTVLSPASIHEEDNNNCITLMAEAGGKKILLLGDVEMEEEADILAAGFDLDCDLITVGHHGSAFSTGSALLEKTKPAYAFISCGAENKYGHPHEETLERLAAAGTQIFRSDLQGTITAQIVNGEMIFDQAPCNDFTPGTMMVDDPEEPLTDPETVQTVQKNLNQMGYDCGTPDGVAGSGTVEALKRYQTDAGLSADGVLTQAVADRLNEEAENSPEAEAPVQPENVGMDYVININTGKFHIPSCGSVKQMKDKNKRFFTGNRDELIGQGYDPCGNCKP